MEPTNQELNQQANKISHRNESLHAELLSKLDSFESRFNAIEENLKELQPLIQAFKNVQGFTGVTIWIFKALALLGVAIGGLYTFLELIKKISK